MNERLYNDDLPQQVPPGWIVCFNTTDEVIPGYACMEFDTEPSAFINDAKALPASSYAEKFGGQTVIRVRKPGAGIAAGVSEALTEKRGQLFWFNGPSPILPKRFGICTRTMPFKALVFENGLNVGKGLVPLSHEWYLTEGAYLDTNHVQWYLPYGAASFDDIFFDVRLPPFRLLFYDAWDAQNLRPVHDQTPPWVAMIETCSWSNQWFSIISVA